MTAQPTQKKPDPRPADVFSQIMLWLGGRSAERGNILQVKIPLVGGGERVLSFQRRTSMSGAFPAAQCLETPDIRFVFDPNWDAIQRVGEIITEMDPPQESGQ